MSSSSTSTQTHQSSLPISIDEEKRDELLAKARVFLQSPSVKSQDVATRREFLKEKGLSSGDIEQLISEYVRTVYLTEEFELMARCESHRQYHLEHIQGRLLRSFRSFYMRLSSFCYC